MEKYVVLEKPVGETPLECMENWRATQSSIYTDVPLTYAGRLDPLASGKLLVLIGEECKNKEQYLALDKEYEFTVLFDISTDTGDLLGFLQTNPIKNISPRPGLGLKKKLSAVYREIVGQIELPYPKFSSKTVAGKPLHTWTLEGRLEEITIPTKRSMIYDLKLLNTKNITGEAIAKEALEKIATIAPVTDKRKALGNDFRRSDICPTWQKFMDEHKNEEFTLASFSCICSSGTYMRTLANEIAKKVNTTGLAYSIHRTKIGCYQPFPFNLGFWSKTF